MECMDGRTNGRKEGRKDISVPLVWKRCLLGDWFGRYGWLSVKNGMNMCMGEALTLGRKEERALFRRMDVDGSGDKCVNN